MQVYVIRHGLSEGNAAGVIQGYSDSPLTVTGVQQASLLGRYFRKNNISPEIIYSSPLRRAHETAQRIAEQLDPVPSIQKIDALMEVDVGRLSGVSLENAYSEFPEWCNEDVNRWLDFSLAGGESLEDFFHRVSNSVKKDMLEWDLLDDRTIFYVTHAGTMRPIIKTLLDSDSDMMFFTFGNCCHVKIEYRKIRDSVRKVLSEHVRIENIAAILGESNPCSDTSDKVGDKIG